MQPSPNWTPQTRPNLPAKPRRVRGGERLPSDAAGAASWAAQRWNRLIEQAAEGPALVEGLEYAKLGQTRRLTLESGRVEASVQGRQFRAYTTALTLPTFDHAQWQRVIEAMAGQAIYAAKLLAGELPQNIEDVFGPLGLKLFPTEPADVPVSCTCADHAAAVAAAKGAGTAARLPWCKHACCVASLVAGKLGRQPFLMFFLRGLSSEELLERIRQLRTIAGAGQAAVAVYAPRVPGVSDETSEPLEQTLDKFWEVGPHLHEIDLPIEPPAVSHPLLRRLGPSPFQGSNNTFPLVGLLATCYEIASQDAIRRARGDDGTAVPAEGAGAAPDGAGEEGV